MSKISGKNTRPEIQLRKLLHSGGFRFRLHDKKLPGKPDIVLPKYKTVILSNGCFWHFHEGCEYSHIPSTRTEYWSEKLNNNKRRDKMNIESLISLNWNVIVVWDCWRDSYSDSELLDILSKTIKNGQSHIEIPTKLKEQDE